MFQSARKIAISILSSFGICAEAIPIISYLIACFTTMNITGLTTAVVNILTCNITGLTTDGTDLQQAHEQHSEQHVHHFRLLESGFNFEDFDGGSSIL